MIKYILLLTFLSSCGLKKVNRITPQVKNQIKTCHIKMSRQDILSYVKERKSESVNLTGLLCAKEANNKNMFNFFFQKIDVNKLSAEDKKVYFKLSSEFYIDNERYDLFKSLLPQMNRYNDQDFLETKIYYHLYFSRVNKALSLIKKLKDQNKKVFYSAWYHYITGNPTKALSLLGSLKSNIGMNKVLLNAMIKNKKVKIKDKRLSFIQSLNIERHNATATGK